MRMKWKTWYFLRLNKRKIKIFTSIFVGLPLLFLFTVNLVFTSTSQETVKVRVCDKSQYYNLIGLKLDCNEYYRYDFILSKICKKHDAVRFVYEGSYYDYYDENVFTNFSKYLNKDTNVKMEIRSNGFGFKFKQIVSLDEEVKIYY